MLYVVLYGKQESFEIPYYPLKTYDLGKKVWILNEPPAIVLVLKPYLQNYF